MTNQRRINRENLLHMQHPTAGGNMLCFNGSAHCQHTDKPEEVTCPACLEKMSYTHRQDEPKIAEATHYIPAMKAGIEECNMVYPYFKVDEAKFRRKFNRWDLWGHFTSANAKEALPIPAGKVVIEEIDMDEFQRTRTYRLVDIA